MARNHFIFFDEFTSFWFPRYTVSLVSSSMPASWQISCMWVKFLSASESNFFQLHEGEERAVKELNSNIKEDPRHKNVIKFLEKPITRPAYDGYICQLVTDSQKYDQATLKNYLHHIEVLDPESQKAVKRVIEVVAF